mmetsp:Transcript_85116/g.237498  ORF Transcript_85116/g.237498 Transcript_85116/m.237498 type:complete len:261 (+) Transcript_85116:1388-2170(+)
MHAREVQRRPATPPFGQVDVEAWVSKEDGEQVHGTTDCSGRERRQAVPRASSVHIAILDEHLHGHRRAVALARVHEKLHACVSHFALPAKRGLCLREAECRKCVALLQRHECTRPLSSISHDEHFLCLLVRHSGEEHVNGRDAAGGSCAMQHSASPNSLPRYGHEGAGRGVRPPRIRKRRGEATEGHRHRRLASHRCSMQRREAVRVGQVKDRGAAAFCRERLEELDEAMARGEKRHSCQVSRRSTGPRAPVGTKCVRRR